MYEVNKTYAYGDRVTGIYFWISQFFRAKFVPRINLHMPEHILDPQQWDSLSSISVTFFFFSKILHKY
jgi:hypothetical protein